MNGVALEKQPGQAARVLNVSEGEKKVIEAARALSPREATLASEGESSLPMNVKDAARFLGVSPQTVYLWVERKQIPHLRVMGRNIRFLKSDLLPFRAQFKREVENGQTA